VAVPQEVSHLLACVAAPRQYSVVAGKDDVITLVLQECARQVHDTIGIGRDDTHVDARRFVEAINVTFRIIRKFT
jgi:hypothetical protein